MNPKQIILAISCAAILAAQTAPAPVEAIAGSVVAAMSPAPSGPIQFAPIVGPNSLGPGLTTVQSNGLTIAALDFAYVLYRAQVPQPGTCLQGTGALAIDAQNYLYFCVPDGTGQDFIWARTAAPIPIVTTW